MTPAFQPCDPLFEERVRASFASQGFMRHIGAVMTCAAAGQCEIQLDYRPELTQQHGYFHAGVIGTLADNAGGYAALSLMPAGCEVLTVEYKMNFLRPGSGERLISRGRVLKSGRTLTVTQVDVFTLNDGVERLAATALLTMMGIAANE